MLQDMITYGLIGAAAGIAVYKIVSFFRHSRETTCTSCCKNCPYVERKDK